MIGNSLFKKILLLGLIMVLTVVICLNLLLVWFFHHYVHQEQKNQLIETTAQMEISGTQYRENRITLDEWLSQMRALENSNTVHTLLVNNDFHVIFSSVTDATFIKSQLPNILSTAKQHLGNEPSFQTIINNASTSNDDILLTSKIIEAKKPMILISYIMVEDINNLLGELLKLVFFASLIIILVAIPLLYILSRHLTQPLKAMELTAMALGSGNFQSRIKVKRNDEIGQLGHVINKMASQLERTDKTQQAFLGNVSHELRTPLTSIRGFTQGILDGNIPPSKHTVFIAKVYEESCRLSVIVEDLLSLAKLKGGVYEIKKDSFDFTQLCNTTLEELQELIVAQKLKITLEAPNSPTIYYGDAYKIKEIIINLLENAIKHTKDTIQLKIYTSQHNLHLEIKDNGEGIDSKDLPFIFEQFYKGKGNIKNGTGLGLAISMLIAKAHGGSIAVQSNEKKGCIFTLMLPL
jgi:signal transduction histidine kinase